MPDPIVVLAVLVAALALTGGGALALADRATAPLLRETAVPPAARAGADRALRTVARRSAVALLVSLVALIGLLVIADGVLRTIVADAVFAAPVLAAAIGIVVHAALQSRPLQPRSPSSASLRPRRPQDFAQRRSFVVAGLLGAMLIALAGFALVATPAVAAFQGPRAVALLVAVGALLAAVVLALRRIAVRAALPDAIAAVDPAARRLATRFVLLLSSSATLATAALVALQAGGWLWENTPVLLGSTPSATLITVVGAAVSVIGALAAVGSLASAVAVSSATLKAALGIRRTAPRSVPGVLA